MNEGEASMRHGKQKGHGTYKTITKLAAMAILAVAGNAFANTELAKVNGRAITDKDLRSALGGLNEPQKDNILKDANSRRQILNSIIDQEVLTDEARKEKLDQDQDYKDALAAFQKQYLASKILQKNLGAKMSESSAKKYYDAHKQRYSTDQVQAQHILVSDEEKAREIMKLAQAPNADFQELAEKNSKDPSAKNNRGDLGFFGRDRMVPEFTEAAFQGKEGEIVGPVKTSYGYHIIKVVKKKPGKILDFEDVEVRVKNDLRNELTQNYVSKLRAQAKIQVNDKAVDTGK